MKKLTLSLIGLATISLTACGGGSSGGDGNVGGPSTPGQNPADGFWVGTTDNGYDFDLAVRANGDVWMIYYDGGYASGMLHGKATGTNDSISAAGVLDHSFEDGTTYTIDIEADINSNDRIVGTATYPAEARSLGFNGDYDRLYDGTPSLGLLAGTYVGSTGDASGSEGAAFTVNEQGTIDGDTEFGCEFSGSADPDASGNLYTISITYDSPDCLHEGRTFTGIAVYDDTSGFAYAAVVGSRDSEAFLFLGERYLEQ